MSSNGQKKRILILGGGFGAVYTAMFLGKAMTAAELEEYEITIVSTENYIVFQPLLPEVISGTIEMLHCITPIRRLAKKAQLYSRKVEAIDFQNRVVRLAPEFVPRPIHLDYEHLVIALGTRLNYDVVPGMREHAFPFKYLGDALRLRNHVVGTLEEANIETDPAEKRRLLTFAVGGGGFSGVECIAELNDFLKNALNAYRNIRQEEIRCILVQSAVRILPELKESLAKYAHGILEGRGIEIRLNTRLKAVSSDGFLIADKAATDAEKIESRTVVTTVPAAPHELVSSSPCELERGRIKTTEYLDVPGQPGVWALGDCAAVPQRDGITSPPTAQHALRQAKTCAGNILATLRGTKRKPFLFTGLGKLASLGHRSAVAEVFGIKLWGFLAWLVWRAIYLSKFPGLDRRIRVATDWLLDILLPRDITQVQIFQPDAVIQEHFLEGEIVFDAGDFGDKLYVIVKGEVEVVVNGNVVATLKDGEIFGERALVSSITRTARIMAKTDLDIITVSLAAFQQLVTHLPGVKSSINEIMKRHGVDPQQLEAAIPDDQTSTGS
jgi:NADH dehydrogenase